LVLQEAMPDTDKQLFVITASNPEASAHVGKSIASPIDSSLCQKHFKAEQWKQVAQLSRDGKFYAWGALPGQRNLPNWEKMRPGDYVLLYQNGQYTFHTTVISKYRNANFARALWGTDQNGMTWELMYFLQPPVRLGCSAQKVADVLPSQYMGFTPIAADNVQNIVTKYDSIDKFFEQRMVASEIFLLLRSNEESSWSDKEGSSYHYGSTVANHTAVVRGAQFLLDRVYSDARRVFGCGTIGAITEEAGSGRASRTFRADYQQYRPLRPARLLTEEDESLLASLPGYNVQHSIHKITEEVFERLSKPATAWIFQSNPERYQLKSALQKLKKETWLVSRYRNEIRKGGRVYLWQSGDDGGIVGLADVIEEPRPQPESPESAPFVLKREGLEGDQVRALLRYTAKVDPPISRKYLLTLPALSNLSIFKQSQGSNFRVSPVEAEVIEDLLATKSVSANARSECAKVNENTGTSRNLILYGPPGTGKTYQTVNKALEVLDLEYAAANADNREQLKVRFDDYVSSGRIRFVTFHQSFAYEDFVEGIRADTAKGGQLRYEVKDGIFAGQGRSGVPLRPCLRRTRGIADAEQRLQHHLIVQSSGWAMSCASLSNHTL
jgi:hypothetical protein